jgi:hypothetical protein
MSTGRFPSASLTSHSVYASRWLTVSLSRRANRYPWEVWRFNDLTRGFGWWSQAGLLEYILSKSLNTCTGRTGCALNTDSFPAYSRESPTRTAWELSLDLRPRLFSPLAVPPKTHKDCLVDSFLSESSLGLHVTPTQLWGQLVIHVH